MDEKGNKTYIFTENQRNSVMYFLTSFLATLVFSFKRQLNEKEEKKKRGEREKKRRRRKRLDSDPAHPPSLNKQTRILTRRPDSGPPFSARPPEDPPLTLPAGSRTRPGFQEAPGFFGFGERRQQQQRGRPLRRCSRRRPQRCPGQGTTTTTGTLAGTRAPTAAATAAARPPPLQLPPPPPPPRPRRRRRRRRPRRRRTPSSRSVSPSRMASISLAPLVGRLWFFGPGNSNLSRRVPTLCSAQPRARDSSRTSKSAAMFTLSFLSFFLRTLARRRRRKPRTSAARRRTTRRSHRRYSLCFPLIPL